MGGPPGARMVSPRAAVRRCHTAELTAAELVGARRLMDVSFDDFTEHDWDHALGGMHALVTEDAVDAQDAGLEEGRVVAHASLVLRRLLVGGRALRCGYVEAVAVHPRARRRGLGSAVMASLEELAPAYDVLALGSSEEGLALYRGRGWEPWRGPSSAITPSGLVRTPDDDGGWIHVLRGAVPLDVDAPIACDWRDGDVW